MKNYPVVLFAHAKRPGMCPDARFDDPTLFDITLDYTRVNRMLHHLASWGCVIAVPDLSGAFNIEDADVWPKIPSTRAQVLIALYQYLMSLNSSLFRNGLDMNRLLLVGHSQGASACLVAHAHLSQFGIPSPLAIALIAPAVTSSVVALSAQTPSLLVMKGTADVIASNVDAVFTQAASPKTLVTVHGANHFGYTDLCPEGSSLCFSLEGPSSIPPFQQQITGGAYLAAMMRRYALGDTGMQQYLSGQQLMGGLVGTVEIQSLGM